MSQSRSVFDFLFSRLRPAILASLAAAAALSGCGGESDPFARGERALAARNVGAAAREFQRALDADQRNYDARVKLAHCLRALNDRDRAIDQFEKAFAQKPSFPYPLLSIVLCHFEEGQSLAAQNRRAEADDAFNRALAAGERLAASFPEEARGFELAARVHVSRFANYYQAIRNILIDHFSDAETDRMLRRMTADVYAHDWGLEKRGVLRDFFEREYPFRDIDPLMAAIDDLRTEYESVLGNFEHALRLDPALTSAARDLASILVEVGSLDESRNVALHLLETDLSAVAEHLEPDELKSRETDVNHAHRLLADIEERRVQVDAIEERERQLRPIPPGEDAFEDEPARIGRKERFNVAAAELELYVEGPAPAAEKLRARERLCRCYYETGDLADMKRVSESIRKEKPGNAIGKLYYGVSLYYLDPEKLVSAIDLVRDAILAIPGERHGHYVLGLAYRDQGKVTQAVQSLRKAISLDTDDVEAHRALLELSMAQGWHEDALDEAKELLRLDGKNVASRRLVERAEIEALNRGPVTAEIRTAEDARAILRREPGQLYARFRLAEIETLAHNPRGALREIEQILKIRPRFYPVKILEARAVGQTGDVARARFLLQDLAGREPNRPQAFLEIARLEHSRHRSNAALRFLNIAERIAPDETETKIFGAELFLRGGLVEKAANRLKSARETDPGDRRAAVLAARIATRLGEPAKAEADMRRLAAEHPDFAPARIELASALVAQGRDSEAEAALVDILSRMETAASDPEDEPSARTILVDVYARQGRVEDAIRELLAMTERGDHTPAAMALSRIHESRGDLETASHALRQGLRFDPDNDRLLTRLGDLALALDDRRQAIRYYQRAARIDPQNAPALKAIAEIRGEGGTKQDRRALLLAIKVNRDDIGLNVRLAEMLLAERKYGAVRAILKNDRTPEPVKRSPEMRAIEVQLYRMMGEPDRARERLESFARNASPEDGRTFAPLAVALGANDLARRLFERARDESVPAGAPPDEKPHLGLALLSQSANDIEGAARHAADALAARPDSLPAKTFAAFLDFAASEPAKAMARLEATFPDRWSEDEFRAAVESAAATPALAKEIALLFNQAVFYSSSKALRNLSAESYRRIISILPQNAIAYDRLSALHIAANDRLSALRVLEEQMKRNPAYVPAYVRAGRLLFQVGRAGEGERLFREALDLAPNDPGLRRELALRLGSRGKPALLREALKHADRAISLDPGKNSDLLVIVGRIRDRLGDGDGAVAALEEAISRRPDDPEPYQALLKLYRNDPAKHKVPARKLCEEMARRFPAKIETRDLLARLLVTEKKLDEAKAEFEAMKAASPFVAAPFGGLAEVAEAKGDPEEALRMRRAAVALDPGRFKDALVLAQRADREGKVRPASELYETVLAFQPDNRVARLRLVELECRRKRFDIGLGHARIGAEKFPADAAMQTSLGYALSMSGRSVEAQRVLERVVDEIAPDYGLAHFHLGDVLARRRLNDRAAEALKKAIELGIPAENLTTAEKLLDDVAPRARRGGRGRVLLPGKKAGGGTDSPDEPGPDEESGESDDSVPPTPRPDGSDTPPK